MQPKLCTKCKKNIAVVFITKLENGVTMNEGYCLKCARSLGIPQIDQAVKQMGFSDEDLDNLSEEMSGMFGQQELDEDQDEDEREGRTATFPMLNQMLSQMLPGKKNMPEKKDEGEKEQENGKKKTKKHNNINPFMKFMLFCLLYKK